MGDNGHNWGPQDDFERLVSRARELGLRHRSLVWKVGLAVVALVLLATSCYQVEPDEVGATRHARFHRVVNPGPVRR